MKQKSKSKDMLHGPLAGKIFLMALPLALSGILQQLFNSADVAVVGRFAGSEALAAVGCNAPVTALFVNVFVGLAVGANVKISQYIGQGDNKRISGVVQTVMMFALICGAALFFVGMFSAEPLLRLMGTPDDVMNMAVLYLRIYCVGIPFLILYNFGAAILRSIGDTKRPMYILFLSGLINICLNLLLVIPFQMGVAGVAIATTVSNLFSMVVILYLLCHEQSEIRLCLKHIQIDFAALKKVIQIGAPAALQSAVFSVSNVCLQSGINSLGSSAMAGSSAALNYEYFDYFAVTAFNQAAITFIGQNYGAAQYERCKKIFRISLSECALVSFIMSITFTIFRDFFVGIYTTDPSVVPYAMIRMTHVVAFHDFDCYL